MYTPTADGGHALYTWELMTALTQRAYNGNRFELVTSQDLAPEFRATSYPVHAILPPLSHRGEFSNSVSWAANRIVHYPQREWRLLDWLKDRPDVVGVHFQEYKPWLAKPLFRRIRKHGKKIFYTVHNIRPHKYPAGIPKWLMDRWNRDSWRMCDGLFVHTRLLADELSRFLGKPHPPIHVSPHGTWTVREPVAVPPLEERLKWKRLLFFGTIRRNKGLDLLLRAAELLPGFSITIAGEPFDQDYYRQEILPQVDKLRAMGVPVDLRDRFTPQEEVGPLFASHSAIVLPYTQKFLSQSGVVFLALAHELPVVASEVGGLRDLFSEFQIGTTFDDPSPQGVAAAVRRLYDAGCQRDILGQIRSARSHYSWEAAAEATMAAYGLAQPVAGAVR